MGTLIGMSTKVRCVSSSIHVSASPAEVFAMLCDPDQHRLFDGSGMVRSSRSGTSSLELGSKFGMNMKLGPIPYRMNNTVVEFEHDRLIAWAHIGGHRWRYELEADGDGTRVTESFDWSTSKAPWFIELMNYHTRNHKAIVSTLERLQNLLAERARA